MKIRFFVFCFLLLCSACEGPPRGQTVARDLGESGKSFAMTPQSEGEEYVMVTTAASLPLYVAHDQEAFKKWGAMRGVKISIVGPPDWDIPGQVEAIEQVIATRPAGMLINGTDPGIAASINKAVEAGIPTVVYDSDVPSKRHCFLGSDWYQMGYKQGEALGRLAEGKPGGKVAALGILGMSNQEAGFRGLQDALKKFANLSFIGKFETHNTIETSARVTGDLISAHPDLFAVSGFTSETGPGIALGVKERGKAGRVMVTNVDSGPVLLKYMQEGVIQFLVEQKRETFVWYGAQFLYDMAHNINALPINYLQAGNHGLPYEVNTGLVEITPDKVEVYR
jgi:ribose transport system substrate-binding protein